MMLPGDKDELAGDSSSVALPDRIPKLRGMRTVTLALAALFVLPASLRAQNVSAVAFDGVDDYADGGTSSVFNITDALTLEAWVKVDPVQNNTFGRIIDKFDLVAGTGYNLISNSGHLWMEIFYDDGGGGGSFGVYGNAINDGVWHHVAGVFTGDTIQLYIDGLSDNGGSGGTVTIIPSANNLGIGNNWDGQNYLPLHGDIDEVRIWNVARSAAQILAYKDSCLYGNEAGLVGYWRLDENTGTIAYDLTSNGNDLTLGNGAAWSTDLAFPSAGDCTISSVHELSPTNDITITPNLIDRNESLQVTGIDDGAYTIIVQDLLGRVRSRTVVSLPGRIDLGTVELDAGGYLLTLVAPNGARASTRFVVN